MANVDTNFNLDPDVLRRLRPGRPSPTTPPMTRQPIQMSTGLPANRMTTTATGAPVTLPAFSLPPLDGSQYVATPTAGPQGPSAAQTIGQIGSQFQYQPGESPVDLARRIAQQLGTTPEGLPIEIVQQIQAAFQGPALDSAAGTTLGALDQILNREGSYIGNARRRGLEQASQRGMLNSSIAAGASQRAATEAAQPILSEIMGLTGQREGQDFAARQNAINQAFGLTQNREQMEFDRATQTINNAYGLTQQERDAAIQQLRDQFAATTQLSGQREQNAFAGQQNQLDRTQGVNNALLGSTLAQRQALLGSQLGREEAILDTQLRQRLQSDAAAQQDWLSSQAFTREFNGALSMMPISSSFQMNQMIQQYALENPEIYTPEVISGMTNFFNRNMISILETYFPDMVGGA